MLINGYKYTTEQDAINARKQCADYYNLPIHTDDVTQYYVNYVSSIFVCTSFAETYCRYQSGR